MRLLDKFRRPTQGRLPYLRDALGTSVYVDDLNDDSLRRLLDDIGMGQRIEIYRTISVGRHYARRWESSGTVRDDVRALACIAPVRDGSANATWWAFVDKSRLDDDGRRALREFLTEASAAGEACSWMVTTGRGQPLVVNTGSAEDMRRSFE